MFPLPWKNLKVGEKPILNGMKQVSVCNLDNRSNLEYIPPRVKVKFVQQFNHLGICQGPVQMKGEVPP